ncbi:MAG: carboxypeptidase regulatory-like domain-containing protein [Anaerolineales bacterium]|nr:carboxypeptidase regulatory-like domain-containing protein [Anaerolineales bacterium]
MGDILGLLNDTPVPTILVVGGLVFLALAVIRQISAHIKVESRGQQVLVAVIGIILLLSGLYLYVSPATPKTAPIEPATLSQEKPAPTKVPTSIENASPESDKSADSDTSSPTETFEPTRANISPTGTPPPTMTVEPTPEWPSPAPGAGNVAGRILWNEKPVVDTEVKLCEKVSMFGGCSGYETGTRTDNSGYYLIGDIPPGDYSLVVQAPESSQWLYVTKSLGISARTFTVEAGKTLTMSDNHVYKFDLKILAPAEKSQVEQAPTLSWEPYPDAAYYELYLAPEKGSSIYTSYKVIGNQQLVDAPLMNCSYTWSVEAFNEHQIKIAESDGYLHFTVTGQSASCVIQITSPLNGASVSGSGLVLEWEAHPLASSYKILLWNDTDPGKPHILDFVSVNEPTFNIDQELAPATYVWSIYANNQDGDQIASSDTHNFAIIGQ